MKLKRKPAITTIQLSQGSKQIQQDKLRIELCTWDGSDDFEYGIGVYVYKNDEMVWHGSLCVNIDVELFVKLFGHIFPIRRTHRVFRRSTQKVDQKPAKAPPASQEKGHRAQRGKGKRSVVVRQKRSQRHRP